MNPRQKFDAKFRAQAVELAEMSDRPRCRVALDLGISDASLFRWMTTHKNTNNDGDDGSLSETEREELARLRKEKREWAMEREILKKRRPSGSRNRTSDPLPIHRHSEGDLPDP